MPAIVNIAAYKFVPLDRLDEHRDALRRLCRDAGLKGTILLTPEGINLFIAGDRAGVDRLLDELRSDPALTDLPVKESYSDDQPFARMLVKVKLEIIAFGVEGIAPTERTSPKLGPRDLHEWLSAGKPVHLLDVRNDYEVELGTFHDAHPVGIDHFREFPDAVSRLPEEWKDEPVVMFCTGGIRCEKAGPYMEQAGFRHVFQLDGGILRYFEECGGAHYDGDCFVFDKRVALNANLEETDIEQCYACQHPLTVDDQQSPHYVPGHACPHCYQSADEQRANLLRQRTQCLGVLVDPQPGSVPYHNRRPLSVPGRFDQRSLIDFLDELHPHIGRDVWLRVIAEGHITIGEEPAAADRIVRSGERYVRHEPNYREPDVNWDVAFLYEDAEIIVLSKPAPLPVHPSGRFHRNTLSWVLREVYRPLRPSPIHRLDANTTGIVVFAKTRRVSSLMQPLFEQGQVKKRYLARVIGVPAEIDFVSEAAISRTPTECGGRVIDALDGLPSRTEFRVLRHFGDGTTLLECRPITGRTNQIRVHLWHVGLPIVGDSLYLPNHELGQQQTTDIGDTPLHLHAADLSFTHPSTGELIDLTAPPPHWSEVSSSVAR